MLKITTEFSDELIEKIVRAIMDNYPEAGSGMSLKCIGWKYDTMEFTIVDVEEGKEFELTKEKLLAGFPLMFTDKWPKGLTKPPMKTDWEAWDEWLCQSDAFSFDAFLQLVCLGEVIYG